MGLLLNVDYSDPLARARAWKILRSVGSDVVGEEEAIDAYYLHYRVPIFGGRVSSPVWRRFVRLYINSPYYDKIAPLCRLRHGPSLRVAVSLLRAFVDYLKSLEEFGRAWFGRGRRDAWVEALRHLRRHFGDPSDIEMLYTVFRKLGEILGRGRVGDPASFTLSMSADPRRVKIARILAKALELYRLMGRPAELGPVAPTPRGIERQRVYGSLGQLARLSASAWSLFVGAPPLFLYKSLSGELPLNARETSGDGGVYLLIDKSGSMYSAVDGVEKIVAATAYALAVLKSYKKVVARFFDAEVYEPVEDVDKLVDILLRTVASGGTDISKAVEAASRDAEMRKLRGYVLAVVTDLEDEKLNMEVIKRAKGIFREIVFIVVGTARPLQGVKSIRLTPPPPATLFFNTPQI
jgi:uncharacterized protein with von Willebrand factor type A (vWA) domain